MVYLLLSILSLSVKALLDIHTLGPYMSYDSIVSYMQNATQANSSYVKNSNGYLTLSIPDAYSSYAKPTVLFVGSLHGGFPMSSYSVLSYFDYYLSQYSTDNTIKYMLNHTNLVFLPVANTEAYKKAEVLYNSSNSTFTPIWTGLENLWNCSNTSLGGIDPNLNFPDGFNTTGSPCNSTGFSGNTSLQSNTSKLLENLISTISPSILIIFDNQGRKIYYPFASNTSQLSPRLSMYYNYINSSLSKTYTYQQYSNNSVKGGTLLDRAINKGVLSLEIWPATNDSITSANIYSTALELKTFIMYAIQYYNLAVEAKAYNSYSTKSTNSSDVYQIFYNISLTISSTHYSDSAIDIYIDPGFLYSNYSLINATLITRLYYSNVSTSLDASKCISGKVLNCKNLAINGFSDYNLSLTFGVSNSSDLFNLSGYIQPTAGSKHFNTFYISNKQDDNHADDSSTSDHSDDDQRRKAVVTGMVLLIILIVLLVIAGIILYCTQRNKEPEAPHFSSQNKA